ncbi:MAG TPA: DUF6455 family protein [Acetobacteraceae bacterium]|nr:DUF6455 family protein [Acetobacteraceae bacterium]
MLTYDDCVGLSGLSPEEIAAIAEHERLPEIVASGMGACLCRTPEGKRTIRHMIIEDSEDACRRGDMRTAARLGLVLHHFIDAHLDRNELTDPSRRQGVPIPPWVRARMDAYLAAMLRHFGIDREAARERFGPEMQIAEMCCAICTETGRCRSFLTGEAGGEAPSSFCPNAPLLEELGRDLHPETPNTR